MRSISPLVVLLVLTVPAVAAAQVQRPLPVIQRLEPTSGPPGTEVSIVGRSFHAEQTVWLGDVQLEVRRRLPNRWTVVIPEGAETGMIQLRIERGHLPGERFRVLASDPPPTVASFSPAEAAPGDEVLIRGEHFSPRLSENHVHLGETPVVVRNANPTELRVVVPEGATEAPFRVEVTGAAGEATSTASLRVRSGTAIASFEPTFGPPRTRVVLHGTGFHRAASRVRVTVGEARARVVRASPTELTVEVPRDATSGRFHVEVVGGGSAYSEGEFAVRFPPEVRAFEPAFGAPGTRITIRGAHFGADIRQVEAKIGETALRLRDLADGQLVAELPEGAETGAISVTVRGFPAVRARGDFRVVQPVAIERFEPTSGAAGTELHIHGHGFSADRAANTVTIAGNACEVLRASEEELVVRVPETRSGPVEVSAPNAGQARTSRPFLITAVPAIARFEPAEGPAGTEVTIHGERFGTRAGLIEVRLGERQLDVVRATPTEIVVRIPEGARTGTLRVNVRLQGSVTSAEPFTVTSP